MTVWTIARIKGTAEQESLPLLPEKYYTYAVLRDGIVVGELKYDHGRWKSAGGPAWRGMWMNKDVDDPRTNQIFAGCMGIVVYHTNKKAILEWFKTNKMEGRGWR